MMVCICLCIAATDGLVASVFFISGHVVRLWFGPGELKEVF
jgi:hypothetical protein